MNQANEYSEYRNWKNWAELFQPSRTECLLFQHEFDGLALKDKRFLDIGFGSGALLAWARQQGAHVEGMEILEELNAAASERGIPTWKLIVDIPDEYFDIVTLLDVCEHIHLSKLEAYFRDLCRIIKPTGVIIIRVPNCQSPLGWINQAGDHTHVSQLSGPILKWIGEQAGLHCVKIADAVDERSLTLSPKSLVRCLLQSLTLAVIRYSWGSRSTPASSEVIVHFCR